MSRGPQLDKRVSPWALTPAEAEVMDAVLVVGCTKSVARQLNIASYTVKAHTQNVRVKMSAPNTLVAAVRWDRWRRHDVQYQAMTHLAPGPAEWNGATVPVLPELPSTWLPGDRLIPSSGGV